MATYVLPIALLLIVAVFAIRGIADPTPPTPETTFTPAPPAIGADWINGCISTLWKPWPTTVQITEVNGCLSEPVNLFFAEDGRLTFLTNERFENPQVYGLFAPLPENGAVRIDTLLRIAQEGEIWLGVFGEPNIGSQGLVAVLPPGENIQRRELIQRKMPEQAEIHRVESFSDDPTQDPPLYTIVFELNNGEVRVQKLGETEFTAVRLDSAQPWLFVGYQVAAGDNRIDAEFLNLIVQ